MGKAQFRRISDTKPCERRDVIIVFPVGVRFPGVPVPMEIGTGKKKPLHSRGSGNNVQ
jgi:hypothetical protein